jgi:hypothetical protein
MRKSEMTTEQLQIRAQVVEVLTAAGWLDADRTGSFERDLWTQHDATLTYENGSMSLRAALSLEHRTIDLRLSPSRLASGGEIALSIGFRDVISTVLAAIVAVQERATLATYQDAVEELVRRCPEIHVLAGSDDATWVRLTSNEQEDDPRRARDKNELVARLVRAGWQVDADPPQPSTPGDRRPEAVAELENAHLRLLLSYYPDGWLRLQFTGAAASELLPLRLAWKDAPGAVVDALIRMQESLSAERYPVAVALLVDVCKSVHLETPQGLVQVEL